MSTRAFNVVLVHGGFVDGSGWRGVHRILSDHGYEVSVIQNSTASLASDVAVTTMDIAAQSRPVILVGHSYGGVVVTEAGNHPKVAGLVYIAAFVPDVGETQGELITKFPGSEVGPVSVPDTRRRSPIGER